MHLSRRLVGDEYLYFLEHSKNIQNVQMLADILDLLRKSYFHYRDSITLSELLSFANDINNSHYRQFSIKKKNGGKRIIFAPDKRLMEIQECIRILLNWWGIHCGGSITKYAASHVGREVVFNMDIKDFYPSINAAKIISKLLAIKRCQYDVAILIVSLVTIRSKDGTPVLPQGSPSSPVIASLVVQHLDARLSGYAAKHGIYYTRYVDDITFSCSKSAPWPIFAKIFKKIINSEGFQLNEKKNRFSFYYQRQEVLGLTVNSKLNVTQRYIKQLRTILHNWEKDGYEFASNKFMMHYFKNMVNPKRKMPKMEHIISGKLSYLKMVRSIKLVKNSEIPKLQSFSLFSEPDFYVNEPEIQLNPNGYSLENFVPVWVQLHDNGYTMKKVEDPVWVKLHERYIALLHRDFGYKEQ